MRLMMRVRTSCAMLTSIHDTPALAVLFRAERIDPQQLQVLRRSFLRRSLSWEESLAALSPRAREVCSQSVAPHALTLDARFDSAHDGASRLVFRTGAGHRLETVLLRIASGRTSLCLSTQVGCAAKCSFCATGQMGLVINLSATEILDQVVQAGQITASESRRVRNLIFMGMGEPLHNEDNLYAALEQLTASRLFAFAPERVVVSTVGIAPAMQRLSERFPKIRLAVSLHSARQEVRGEIIPLARRYSVTELRGIIQEINARSPGRVMLEYLMLSGLTDTDDDLAALRKFAAGLRVHINLIPFNAIDPPADSSTPQLLATSRARIADFANDLRESRLPVTIRYSLGADVAAACGQLVQRRSRQLVGD
jgi:23S rRNA (adenine2503-C2)-methyltransferase